ncbi:MAG: hypothetical protein Crog4KO_25960 [Crocinitomicaceae bacterium]
MSYKHDIIKERFDIQVTRPNATEKGEFEIDRNAEFLYGVAVTSDNDELVYYRGSQKIQLNDQELFPEQFESKMLMAGLSVPPNQRMAKVGMIRKGNGRVDLWYTDEDHPATQFIPYRVSFYFFSKVS